MSQVKKAGIRVVTKPSEEYLSQRQLTDYREHRERLIGWMVNIGEEPYVLGLGRRTRRTLTVNLAIAFGAILLRGTPLPLAVVGHEGSTVLVSLNGLRLLGFRE
nr:hypothetical protein [Halorubrum sp. CBA1125]